MMMFSASSLQLWTAAATGCVAALLLALFEWRRPQRQHLAARIAASLVAVGALALLGLHPAWRVRRHAPAAARNIRAALWTPGAAAPAPADIDIPPSNVFALPGAAAAPPDAVWVPDVATLRRYRPEIDTLFVFGDGLEPAELDALRAWRVLFQPPPTVPSANAAIHFISWPHALPLGEPFIVQGSVGGLSPGSRRTLKLTSPAGVETETATAAADAAGRASFTLPGDAPPAAGRFRWHIRVLPPGQSGVAEETESLGAAVVPPVLPRVLVLETSPHFDTADLRRWFADAGGELDARTQVGRDRYRFAAADSKPPPEFSELDRHLLARYDLVLADASALAALKAPEAEALRTAIRDGGLGLLALLDDTPVDPPPARALFPWQFANAAAAAPDEGDHLARPAWIGMARPIAAAVPTSALTLTPLPGATELIRDGQGRVLAAAQRDGRGNVAVTLLRDTGRWLRANDPAAFEAYWSLLFSRLARPISGASGPGRWTLAENAAGPVFGDRPVRLEWSGMASPAATASVVAASGQPADNAVLALARDPAEPDLWQGTFWPRRAGWYRASVPVGGGGAPLDFHVDAVGSWPAVAATYRQLATRSFAEASEAVEPASTAVLPVKGNATLPAVGCFLLFLTGAGFLWGERRFAAW
jgi:hypothetical protein